MNGVHDMGGMQGFGPVVREQQEPLFHAPWERQLFGIMAGVGRYRLYHTDEFRRAIESMEPAEYLAASYYERWLRAIETNLIEKGVLSREAIEARLQELCAAPDAPPPSPGAPVSEPPHAIRTGGMNDPAEPSEPAARFSVGDRVLTRNMHPRGHTRLPRYARGKHGVIERVYRAYLLPDTNAHGLGHDPQPVYSVGFTAAELWGDAAEPNQHINIDLWESYLQRVEPAVST